MDPVSAFSRHIVPQLSVSEGDLKGRDAAQSLVVLTGQAGSLNSKCRGWEGRHYYRHPPDEQQARQKYELSIQAIFEPKIKVFT